MINFWGRGVLKCIIIVIGRCTVLATGDVGEVGGGVKFSGVLVLDRKILARTLRVLCEEE